MTTLARLYAGRAGLALVWAAATAVVANGDDPGALLGVLLVAYPLLDAAAVGVELRISRATGGARASALGNIALSIVASVAIGWAWSDSAASALTAWGVWALASGATQLVTAATRRRTGGQWPLIVSGGLSVLVGIGFVAQSMGDDVRLTSLAGYAAAGAAFFVVAAVRLHLGRDRSAATTTAAG